MMVNMPTYDASMPSPGTVLLCVWVAGGVYCCASGGGGGWLSRAVAARAWGPPSADVRVGVSVRGMVWGWGEGSGKRAGGISVQEFRQHGLTEARCVGVVHRAGSASLREEGNRGVRR